MASDSAKYPNPPDHTAPHGSVLIVDNLLGCKVHRKVLKVIMRGLLDGGPVVYQGYGSRRGRDRGLELSAGGRSHGET